MSVATLAVALQWKAAVEPVREVLAWLKDEHSLDAVAAGGCLRDIWHGEDVKDLDIFISGFTHESALNKIAAIRTDLVQEGVSVLVSEIYYGTMAEEIVAIAEFKLPELDYPVQLIFMSETYNAKSIINRIDMGLCRIGVTLTEDIITAEFLNDAENKTFTVIRANDPHRSANRFKRLHKKYPQHRFVCEGYDEWGNDHIEQALRQTVERDFPELVTF